MISEKAKKFVRVFGSDGRRDEAQKAVWKIITDEVYRPDYDESLSPRTARNLALFIFFEVNKDEKRNEFAIVFGADGTRNDAQKLAWKLITDEVYRRDSVDKANPRTARDLALDFYLPVTQTKDEE